MACEWASLILDLLKTCGDKLPAKNIAKELGISKHEANRYLYRLLDKDEVRVEEGHPPHWYVECEPATCVEEDDTEPMETEAGCDTIFGGDIDVLSKTCVMRLKTLNPVSAVNEFCMITHRPLEFCETRSGGQDHCPNFTCTIVVSGKLIATATGTSRKLARHAACATALIILIDNCGISF
uniref:Double-stranded RNA-binding protein n=1 Tax=Tillquist parapoxvirus TaxID=240709 RepID=Q7T6C1_ORFV|nr:double-stranded RNA-binding protein [Tillquist parapoxvirus]